MSLKNIVVKICDIILNTFQGRSYDNLDEIFLPDLNSTKHKKIKQSFNITITNDNKQHSLYDYLISVAGIYLYEDSLYKITLSYLTLNGVVRENPLNMEFTYSVPALKRYYPFIHGVGNNIKITIEEIA